jgi:nucleoid-associated protein YgaU
MALGWKSFGTVGAASVVCVGALYGVLVREPTTATSSLVSTTSGGQPAAPAASNTPASANTQAPAPAASNLPAKPDNTSSNAGEPAGQGAPGKTTDIATVTPTSGTPGGAKPNNAKPDASSTNPAPAGTGQVQPTFDVARVEPAGDSVIAGRAAPGATVELLRNGNTYARAVADVGGQWAIVPPPLPKGPGELTLRATSSDGHVVQSEQTISVRVPEQPGEEVVIVLNTPDQPSKVLTDATPPSGKPVANAQVASAPPTQALPSGDGAAVTTPSAPTPNTPRADAAKTPTRANAAIRTVEADESGRFFVTGMAEPGAALRIYLNDTLVTALTAAQDGTFSMTIEKGMLPGDYKVRVDDVATTSGQVLTRAEVPFAMTEKTAGASSPTVVASNTPGKPATTRGAPGTSQGQPASIQAPGTTASSGVPVASAGNGDAGNGDTKPAAAGEPAQGTSPAAGTSNAGAPGMPNASGPAAATQTAPGNQAVQVGTASATGAASSSSNAVIPEIRTTTIVQGDNLWRISRKIYGQGTRYTWIYEANTKQIRNPNLIYPGQIFVMPEKKAP